MKPAPTQYSHGSNTGTFNKTRINIRRRVNVLLAANTGLCANIARKYPAAALTYILYTYLRSNRRTFIYTLYINMGGRRGAGTTRRL